MDWFYELKGKQQGPTTLESLKKMAQSGALTKDSLVWNETMGEKWMPLAQIPALASLGTVQQDQKAKEEFRKKLAERAAAEKKARAMQKVNIAVTLAVLAGVGCLVWWFVKTAPLRKWKVSSKAPIGMFDPIDRYFVEECKMNKTETTSVPSLSRKTSRMFTYSGAKNTLGVHVSGAGNITLLADDKGVLKAIVGNFPTPGARGTAIVNKSMTSIFLYDYLKALAGKSEGLFHDLMFIRDDAAGKFGITVVPEKGRVDVTESKKFSVVWIEHGDFGVYSTMYFLAVE